MTLLLFAMAVALVLVPQCFYWLRLLPYLWQFSGCETMRFIRHDPLAAIICHACYPLCSIGALDAIKFAVPVAFFVAFQCGFPIFFCRYRSRSFSFRYPLDLGRLRFPLLLGSV